KIRNDFSCEVSSANSVPTSFRATAPRVFEEPSRQKVCAHCAAAPMNQTNTRLRRSVMTKNSAVIIVSFAVLAFCNLGRAQDQELTIDSTIAVARANMQADRTTLVTAAMNFNDKDGGVFWPIYKQYDYE